MNRIVAVLLNRVMLWACGDRLWQRAQEWVKLYEDQEMSGAEKRLRVVWGLREELTALGQDLASSLIHFAIEAAVQYGRRKQP